MGGKLRWTFDSTYITRSAKVKLVYSTAVATNDAWLILLHIIPDIITKFRSLTPAPDTLKLQCIFAQSLSPTSCFMTKANAIFPWSAILGWPWSAQHTRVVGASAGEQDDGAGVAQCRGCHIWSHWEVLKNRALWGYLHATTSASAGRSCLDMMEKAIVCHFNPELYHRY